MTAEELEAACPGWHAWPGVNGRLVYARKPLTSPPKVVRARNYTELRDRIDALEGKPGGRGR